MELYGLIVLFSLYLGIFLLIVTPSESEGSLRPLFELVRQRGQSEICLLNASEATRGAAFFYLGRRTPVLKGRDIFFRLVSGAPWKVLVVESRCNGAPFFQNLPSRAYRLLMEKGQGKARQVSVYLREE